MVVLVERQLPRFPDGIRIEKRLPPESAEAFITGSANARKQDDRRPRTLYERFGVNVEQLGALTSEYTARTRT